MPIVERNGQKYWLRTPVNESPCLKHAEAYARQERAFREAFGAFVGDLVYPDLKAPSPGCDPRAFNRDKRR